MSPVLTSFIESIGEQLLPIIIAKIKGGTSPDEVTLTAQDIEQTGNAWLAAHGQTTISTSSD